MKTLSGDILRILSPAIKEIFFNSAWSDEALTHNGEILTIKIIEKIKKKIEEDLTLIKR